MSSYQPRSTSYHRLPASGRRTTGAGTCFLWFTSGCLFGIVAGVLFVLALATFAAAPILPFDDPTVGGADIVVAVDESYLNSLVAERVNGSYPTGVDGLTLTSLQVDLDTDNRMDLLPTFHVDAGFFFQFDVNARVNNRVSVQDGRLAINMIGDPQLGDLNVSLGILPFDLEGTIRRAVDNINNDLLLSEINETASPSLESANFVMDSVATDQDALTVRLKQK